VTPSRVAFAILLLLTLSDNPSVKTVGIVGLALLATFHIGLYATHPFKPCRTCKGAGNHRSPLAVAYRPCRRCGGSGMRLRTGRKAWNAFTRIRRNHRAATNNRRPNSQHNQGT
jgi:hypothetical protein